MRILTLFTIAGIFVVGHKATAKDFPEVTKLRKDRERLIRIVTDLEVDFAKTLENFDQLHQDYAKLLAKPEIPDQRAIVKDLEKQLEAAAAKIREMQRLEKAKLGASYAKIASLKKDLNLQITNLKADLTRERAAIKLARTQLGEVRTLQIESRKVEEMLRTEIIGRSKLQAEVQVIRGERDALLVRLKESMDQLGKSRESLSKSEARIAGLEKSTRELKATLAQRDAELRGLKKVAAQNKKLSGSIKALEAEKTELNQRLVKQQAEIDVLKKEAARTKILAATIERLEADRKAFAADLKQRDDELGELRKTAMKTKELLASTKKLEEEKVALNTFLKERQQEIVRFQKQLVDQKMMSEKLSLAEKGLTMAKAKVRDGQQRITKLEMELSAEKKIAAKHFSALEAVSKKNRESTLRVAALEKDKTRLQNELSKRDTELKKAMASAADQSKVKAAQKAAAEAMAKIEKEKADLTALLAKRDADLKKARMDLGKLHLETEATKKQMHALKVRFAKIDPVRYALGAANVRDQQARVLRDMQEVLKMFPSARFEIVGHTCDLGSQAGNLKLSQDRAASLKNYLAQNGIDGALLASRGVADAEPLVPNTGESNRRRNRRVEIHILD